MTKPAMACAALTAPRWEQTCRLRCPARGDGGTCAVSKFAENLTTARSLPQHWGWTKIQYFVRNLPAKCIHSEKAQSHSFYLPCSELTPSSFLFVPCCSPCVVLAPLPAARRRPPAFGISLRFGLRRALQRVTSQRVIPRPISDTSFCFSVFGKSFLHLTYFFFLPSFLDSQSSGRAPMPCPGALLAAH